MSALAAPLHALATLLAAHPQVRRLRLAFSGGLDSSVLLHLLAQARDAFPGCTLDAVHVDHGWHAQSAAWARDCVARAAALGVSCHVLAVDARPRPGESPEAAARVARYAALAAGVDATTALLTAHQQDDQAETVLLQLLRGAGPQGLAAMPRDAAFGTGRHWRPLLDVPRTQLHRWAAARGLVWIDDPANTCPDYDRSYLRAAVMPALQARWPALGHTLARAAGLCAEAAEALRTQAAADLAALGAGASLPLQGLRPWPSLRARAALRAWLAGLGAPAPSAAQLQAMLDDVAAARRDAQPVSAWAGWELHRHGGSLYAFPQPAALRTFAAAGARWDAPRGQAWRRDGVGELRLRRAVGAGLAAARLGDAALWLRSRAAVGAVAFRPARRAGAPLKKWLHAAGVPPWWREAWPLLCAEATGAPIAIPGVGVAAEWAAGAGEAGWVLEWYPAAAGLDGACYLA
ncbi:tRNA(Ile)-lysidine synthase [Plasticicumulans lactativorans]|uniref:tRNA(Ile)-lysidine synthase n=1 Tax=Plasticicumulans lactativorans TaxID=1133106 RepID=A0A4R2L8T6_9GAMM|nr:tRNA lysidine(34) synthetase TilS [Plasticicumulans lactativorans]TCO83522.1 tRNA(Ile)-lysidine synthase [Plasticicumulans lactativorans]